MQTKIHKSDGPIEIKSGMKDQDMHRGQPHWDGEHIDGPCEQECVRTTAYNQSCCECWDGGGYKTVGDGRLHVIRNAKGECAK